MREKVVVITNCQQCPNFDYKYYDYEGYCNKLNRVLLNEIDTWENIPEDCPLEDKE